jgi:quercetin dioxygenase-like cupin family protein
MAVKSAFLAVLALTTAAAVAPASAQDLITLDKKAIQALPSKTSPLKITSLPLLQAGGDVVALRVSLPANTDIAPHAHPAGKVAMVTVLSGDIKIGLGDSFNEAALKSLSPGEMVVFRDTDPQHFARTGSGPVELLLVAAPKAVVSQALPGVK